MSDSPAVQLQSGAAVSGTITRLVLSGAFVNVGEAGEIFLPISQLGKTDFRNMEDAYQVGDSVEAYVMRRGDDRVALTMSKQPSVTWNDIYEGATFNGIVERIERFGAFVDIGAERSGMVHVSEMSNGYVTAPEDVVKVGQAVEVRVIKFNRKKRQIDLSMKDEVAAVIEVPQEMEDLPTAMELALRAAQQGSGKRTTDFSGKGKSRRQDRDYYDTEEIYKRTLKGGGR